MHKIAWEPTKCSKKATPTLPAKNFCLGKGANVELGMTVVVASAVNFKAVLGF